MSRLSPSLSPCFSIGMLAHWRSPSWLQASRGRSCIIGWETSAVWGWGLHPSPFIFKVLRPPCPHPHLTLGHNRTQQPWLAQAIPIPAIGGDTATGYGCRRLLECVWLPEAEPDTHKQQKIAKHSVTILVIIQLYPVVELQRLWWMLATLSRNPSQV